MDVSLSSGNFLTAPIQRRRFPLNGTKLFKLQFHLPNNFDHYSLKIDRMQSNSLLEYNPNRLQTDWVLVPSLEAQEPIYQYLNFSLHSGLQSFHQNGPVSFKCIRDKKVSNQKFWILPHCSYKTVPKVTEPHLGWLLQLPHFSSAKSYYWSDSHSLALLCSCLPRGSILDLRDHHHPIPGLPFLRPFLESSKRRKNRQDL